MAASPDSELFSSLMERALRLAARAHRTQTRKSSDVPYLSHPMAVAMILSRAGFDQDVTLAAALLHDVVEDTSLTLQELASEFPGEVVEIVEALSEDKTDADGEARPWIDRKTEHIAGISKASADAKAVALADKLHNLQSMVADHDAIGDELWQRFNTDAGQIRWYYESMLTATNGDDPRITRLQNECRQLMQRLWNDDAVPDA